MTDDPDFSRSDDRPCRKHDDRPLLSRTLQACERPSREVARSGPDTGDLHPFIGRADVRPRPHHLADHGERRRIGENPLHGQSRRRSEENARRKQESKEPTNEKRKMHRRPIALRTGDDAKTRTMICENERLEYGLTKPISLFFPRTEPFGIAHDRPIQNDFCVKTLFGLVIVRRLGKAGILSSHPPSLSFILCAEIELISFLHFPPPIPPSPLTSTFDILSAHQKKPSVA